MSLPFRSKEQRASRRKHRPVHLEAARLEDRCLPAPIVDITTTTTTLTNVVTTTVNNITTVTGNITESTTPSPNSAAGFTSVGELTPLTVFGGDMVQIAAGPGGDFGKGVYAISRGAGANADPNFRAAGLPAPINRPGVIYRVDPATGKASVFFDLNTVLNQIDPGAPAGNGALPSTGLVNWYSIAFDPQGVFDGRPSMFVTSLSSTDPLKNAIYRIGPDGSFMGLFVRYPENTSTQSFPIQPSSIYVPPPEQQTFLRGILVGNGAGTTNPANISSTVPVLFYNANQFTPGGFVTGADPANGIDSTAMNLGPQVGLTSANTVYASPAYSIFTDFGVPASPISPAAPGVSGVQGLNGELLINGGTNQVPASLLQQQNGVFFLNNPPVTITNPDLASIIPTPFRRFQSTAFDYYNYFSYGATVTVGTGTTATTVAPIPPTYAGSLFVTDLSPGLAATLTAGDRTILVPVGGAGSFSITVNTTPVPNPITNLQVTTAFDGGRVIRIGPDGVVTPFASHFHVSSAQDASSFVNSTLSITFSADGTTVYVADMDGIWQFKTVTDLASSTSGSLIGLNDLRTLGVPYEGQNLAAAVVDTGVDANNPLFRGKIAKGKNVVINTTGGNKDYAGVPQGHGTEAAGVVAQIVPQSTIVPINVFTPGQATLAPTVGGTTANIIWNGLQYLIQHPNTTDPTIPNTIDRVVSATFGFGTAFTFGTEGAAYKSFPQTTIALATQFARLRHVGITSVAAAGQLGTTQFGGTPDAAGLLDPLRDSISLPAVINSVVSVTGSYSFPFATGPTTPPTDPSPGPLPNPRGPILVTNAAGAIIGADLTTLTAGDTLIFSDEILGTANRNMTTDFTAPALDIPTFSATSTATTTTVGGTGLAQFQQGGTSLSSALVSGSFTLVASALNYWVNLAHSGGVTVDGYLNTPMGTHQLNFGPHGIGDLSAYLNPDGVNAILQWTAVPITDQPNTLSNISSPPLFPNRGGPYPEISRISVSNAVAAIEGTIALNYLINNGFLDIIDTNHNGLITAQELQTFEDNATNMGMPEAGAMARLLGGTARITPINAKPTAAGETPDQPDVLQRRFNFFDYAANGQLDGVISIPQLKELAKTLLPAPDAFVIIDRQRASANGYLLDPNRTRDYVALQYTSPKYAFIPSSVLKHFKGVSPMRFGVGRGYTLASQTPGYTLFGVHAPTPVKAATSHAKTTAQPKIVAKAATPKTSNSPVAAAAVTSTTSAATSTTTTATSTPGTTPTTTTPTTTTPTPSTSNYQQAAVNSFLSSLAQALGVNPNNKTS
jgi:hypothetical protein